MPSHLSHLAPATTFEQSNIALLGSPEDHQLHSVAAHSEPAWSADPTLGKGAGTWCWVVNDFKLVLAASGPLGQGSFREGDSYIVLHSEAPVPSHPEILDHSIYFWLGSKTSQDEAGVAAYKTVELDEYLEGKAIQYRLLQSQESPSFLSLFRPHFLVLSGGHASGFHHPTTTTIAHPGVLYLVQKKDRAVVVSEVPLKKESLGNQDCYLADFGDKVLQWNGGGSSGVEKAKAGEVARSWIEAREGKAKLEVFDDRQGDTAFFLALGIPSSELPLSFPPPSSSHPTQSPSTSPTYISLPSQFQPQPFSSSILRSLTSPILILPNLIVYVPEKATLESKRSAMRDGQKAVFELGLAGTGSLSVVKEGREREGFWQTVEGRQ